MTFDGGKVSAAARESGLFRSQIPNPVGNPVQVPGDPALVRHSQESAPQLRIQYFLNCRLVEVAVLNHICSILTFNTTRAVVETIRLEDVCLLFVKHNRVEKGAHDVEFMTFHIQRGHKVEQQPNA